MELEKIFSPYFNDVFRYIRRLSGNEHIAEEITADAFFKAMHSIDSFRGDCDIRVWLCQIAKNSYLSYLKKSGHIDNIEDAELKEWYSLEEIKELESRVLESLKIINEYESKVKVK